MESFQKSLFFVEQVPTFLFFHPDCHKNQTRAENDRSDSGFLIAAKFLAFRSKEPGLDLVVWLLLDGDVLYPDWWCNSAIAVNPA